VFSGEDVTEPDIPILIEQSTDDLGTYTTRWMTEPPALGVGFRVLRESWDDDTNECTIYEIRVEEKPTKAGIT
jgi:hypothetical protein